MNNYHIETKPEVHIRRFEGFFGPLWGIVLYVVESRRVTKEYHARVKCYDAERKVVNANYERDKKIALLKAEEIRKNCAADVHFVERWRTGKSWKTTNRFTGNVMKQWVDMHGTCKYCNSPVTKKHITQSE